MGEAPREESPEFAALKEQLEIARGFVDAFDARLAGDLLAEPQSNLPKHALFTHLARLWERYLDLERESSQVAELSCGVIGLDALGRVESVNTRAISLLGFANAGEIVGESVGSLVHDAGVRNTLLETLETASPVPRTIPYAVPTASGVTYLELSVGPHHQPFQCSILVIDVTTRELLEKELRRARDLALAHERRTSEFLSSMSHELRTPMNGVIGMVALLGTTKLDDEQLEIVRLMRRSGDHLLCIINDILDLAKLEAGHVSLDPAAVDFEALLVETVASHEPAATQKGLDVACEIAGNVPYTCSLDRLRVRQVLTNLVGNAIKFTDKGRVTVVCTRPEPTRLRIEVRDTGIGISDEQLPRLFQAFSQADSGATRRFEGTGLGLTISKKLVEHMGGEVGVSSRTGEGSTFWFTLPVVAGVSTLSEHYRSNACRRVGLLVGNDASRASTMATLEVFGWQAVKVDETSEHRGLDAAIVVGARLTPDQLSRLPTLWGLPPHRIAILSTTNDGLRRVARELGLRAFGIPVALHDLGSWLEPGVPPADKGAESVHSLHGTTVLVVEDNVVNQKVVKRLLEKAGASVLLACDGEEAVMSVRSHPEIELVLMDCQMPRVDGFEATRRIRQDHPLLPVCALTADAIAGDKERCFAAGMNDYLTKPIQYDVLVDTIRSWLRAAPTHDGETETGTTGRFIR